MSNPEGPREPWHVFRSWHAQESLWREIYARTVSALLAASVIYLVAALAGVVAAKPALILMFVFLLIGVMLLVFSLPVAIRHWRYMRGLFITWNADPAPEAELARRYYNPLLFGIIITVGSLAFILLLLTQ